MERRLYSKKGKHLKTQQSWYKLGQIDLVNDLLEITGSSKEDLNEKYYQLDKQCGALVQTSQEEKLRSHPDIEIIKKNIEKTKKLEQQKNFVLILIEILS